MTHKDSYVFVLWFPPGRAVSNHKVSSSFIVVEFQMVPVPTVHSGWLLPGLFRVILPAWLVVSFSVKERVRLDVFPSRLCLGLRSVRTRSGSASHRCVWRFGQRLGSDLAPPWGGGLDSVSLLIEEYQTGGKSQYESIKKVGQKKDLPGQGYTSIRCP